MYTTGVTELSIIDVRLEAEGKVSGKTVGKVLRVELNKGRAIGSDSAELGIALGAALDDAPGAALGVVLGAAAGRMLGVAGAASDGAVGMVLRSIEIEERRLTISTE
nr:hypothetical protein CFP56_05452 [Quercus suber]